MKKYLVILLIPFLFSCGGNDEKAKLLQDSLNTANQALSGQVTEKEVVINDFLKSFNEIQDNLNEIKAKEKIVSSNSKDVELQKTKKDEIMSDIQLIYDLMAKNKQKLASMGKKLKTANFKIAELEKLVANLTAQLEEKEGEVTELKAQLEKLNFELTNLTMNYEEEKDVSALKTEKLNTAFYAFGTSKELIKNGVLSKEGGFIGMGKSDKLNQDFNKNYFTKIDAVQTTEIVLGVKKAKLLTNHPSNSYKLEGTKEKIEKLTITNSEEFWSSSKYLVIVVE